MIGTTPMLVLPVLCILGKSVMWTPNTIIWIERHREGKRRRSESVTIKVVNRAR